ncbi:NUDIX hydrolase [Salinispirillum marinum]|uniref:NUDIX hydrolase n=2 Tax=Saccharospirillaceae TaxID=255527 RepID=A0ABV8BHV4_9GAMM
MKFCNQCATPLAYGVPPDDNMPRFHCPACLVVHYENPRIITCTLPIWQQQILLCKRAIEPQLGLWTLPGGFMENGETVAEGALRETWEEARSRPTIRQLLAIVDLPQYHQVHMFYLADMPNADCAPTSESSEVALFHPHEIPWDHLAFRTVRAALEHYVEHRDKGPGLPLLETRITPR